MIKTRERERERERGAGRERSHAYIRGRNSRATYYNPTPFTLSNEKAEEKKASMESNEQGGEDPDGSTSSSYFAMIKISPRREGRYVRYDRGSGGGGEGRRGKMTAEERDKCRCNLHRCRTDVRTYERTKVGLSYDSVCSRGPALDPAKRIFFLFFISSSARPRRRNRRPCITFGSLRPGLLFGIVARPHRHHGPSRSHLSHRPGWNRRFHPP